MVRRFGPTLGAGVVLIERESEKLITPAALGVTAYIGILEKGPLDSLFRAKNKKEFEAKAGKRTPDSLVPDSAGHFYENSNGAGEIWFHRITDGNARKSNSTFRTRQDKFQQSQMLVEGKSEGQWAGKKQQHVGKWSNTVSITATTLTLEDVAGGELNFQTDEWKGAVLTLNGVSGKTYNVVSNTSADPTVITVDADQNMLADLAGSSDLVFNLTLVNSGRSVAILLKDGVEKPATEFAMEVYEDGLKVKEFPNLDTNPLNARYFLNMINDDSSNNSIKVTDNFSGSHVADVRPSNFAGDVESVTETSMELEINTVSEAAAAPEAKMVCRLPTTTKMIADTLVLTCDVSGERSGATVTLAATKPDEDDTLTINGKTYTYKDALTVPAVATEILVGADSAAAAVNTAAKLNEDALDPTQYETWFFTVSSLIFTLTANTAGLLGDGLAASSTGGANKPVVVDFGTAVAGADQTWDLTSSANMPTTASFPLSTEITSGVAYAGISGNPYSGGFKLVDLTRDATKKFVATDVITVVLEPLPDLVGGKLIPNVDNDRRKKFVIASNTFKAITVSPGSTMVTGALAVKGQNYIVEAQVQLDAGLDGLGDIADVDFTTALDSGTSFVKELFGKNKGLVKLATPGNSVTAIQKAGLSLAEALNYQYRVEVTKTIVDESLAEEYINDTFGKSDFGVTIFPSYADVLDPDGDGQLKRVSVTGMVHGREALVARNFDGYHKAAAGLDVTLPQIIQLPTLEKVLDEELLNPNGINVIKKKEGNFIIWGDRSMALDPAFKFKHQREYLSHIENILRESFDFIIFALNNVETQSSLNTTLTAFFRLEFSKGALFGATPEDAFRIKIDDENNTLLTMASGDLNAEITLRIVDTVERFVITIGKAGIFEDLAA